MHNQLINLSLVHSKFIFSRFRVLEDQKAYGIEKVGSPKWQMVLCLIAVFVIVYFSLWKGIKSSGKVGNVLHEHF